MTPVIGIEGCLRHEPVYACLRSQMAESIITDDLHGDAFHAGNVAGRFLEHLDAKPFALAVTQIHALERLRPVLRFGAAGSGLYVEETVVRIHWIREHPPEFDILNGLLDRM